MCEVMAEAPAFVLRPEILPEGIGVLLLRLVLLLLLACRSTCSGHSPSELLVRGGLTPVVERSLHMGLISWQARRPRIQGGPRCPGAPRRAAEGLEAGAQRLEEGEEAAALLACHAAACPGELPHPSFGGQRSGP